MGLYVCVFAADDVDDEIDGVEVGSYDDFYRFRTEVSALESAWGSRFPVLMNHTDSDDEWSAAECEALVEELRTVRTELQARAPQMWPSDSWPHQVLRRLGLRPTSSAESFIDVDGEPLIERLEELARLAASRQRPISFM